MEKSKYGAYPEGFRKLVKDLKIPFPYKLVVKMIMPAFIKILIDG